MKSDTRHQMRYRIEEAIERWRNEDHTAEPGILHLYDPNEVKELARAIRDALVPTEVAETRQSMPERG